MDANLRELSDLVKEVNPQARHRNCRLSFAFVYPDRHGRNVMRKVRGNAPCSSCVAQADHTNAFTLITQMRLQVGVVHSSRPSQEDYATLKSLRFQTGDFLDVAII